MSSSSLPLRTKVFGEVQRRLSQPLDESSIAEIVARRTQRATQRESRLGRLVYGRADRACLIEDRSVDLETGDREPVTTRLRVYRPSRPPTGPLPVVVLFHGGGWVQGDPEQDEWLASRVAVRTPCVVVSVAYRLAPENPFPAAVDDCWAATRWVRDNATTLGADGSRLAVLGDSAGGNLAAVVALLARDAGFALDAQVLLYPGTEMIEKYDSEVRNANAPILTSKGMRAFSRIYLAGADGTLPTAAPIRAASHAGLPPALIQTAGHDPLLDNGRHYADVLRAADVEVDYTCYGDCVHGFLSLPGVSPPAARALDEVVSFLTARLHAD